MKNYDTAYQRLLSLGNLILKPYTDSQAELRASMKRMRDFLDFIGAPDKKLKIVHIAGTSGKGSVVTMTRLLLHNDGKSVGSYTSPHTTTFLERFAVGDRLMSPEDLTEAMNDVLDQHESFLEKGYQPLSFFELSCAIALFAFAKQQLEWCVLETGCGGRSDATNVIGTPRVAVITNIDKDHTEILGNSLTSIAREKAGIIKKNGVVFCGEMRPAIRKVFMKEAIGNNAALFFVHPPYKNIVPDSFGAHQQHNAALVSAIAEELGIHQDVQQRTFATIERLPCRFETMQESPRVILDGAHSPAKIKALAAQLKNIDGRINLLFGATASKDAKEMLATLTKEVDHVAMTRFLTPYRKAANPFELMKLIPKKKQGKAFLDPFEALKHALGETKKNDTLIVTGSLYLTGELRSHWISEEEILHARRSRP